MTIIAMDGQSGDGYTAVLEITGTASSGFLGASTSLIRSLRGRARG